MSVWGLGLGLVATMFGTETQPINTLADLAKYEWRKSEEQGEGQEVFSKKGRQRRHRGTGKDVLIAKLDAEKATDATKVEQLELEKYIFAQKRAE
jgi:hypothetical protein